MMRSENLRIDIALTIKDNPRQETLGYTPFGLVNEVVSGKV